MISTITIGFSRPKGRFFPVGSWLIRLHQRTPYSHCYIRFYSESINRTLVYEAVGSGVRFVSLNMWEKHAEEVESFTLPVKKCNAVSLLQYCVDHAGDDYGWAQNLGLFLANVFGWTKNPWRKGKNCSEAIADILEVEGYKLSKSHDLASPRDIYELLKEKRA
jgi:uncharacterized protein YycO